MGTGDNRVRVELSDRIAVITLDDPGRRNALDLGICEELREAIDAIEENKDAHAVVVTGAGTAFCAGADLSHLGSSQRDGLLAIYEGFLRVARCSLPTVAAVNGPAVGAGMNLALACDVRIVSPSARLDTRFLQLGIHPGGGHTWLLERLVGPETAAAMVLFGEVLDGVQAVERGLAWKVVPDAELLDAAHALACSVEAVDRELLRRTKRTLAEVPGLETHGAAVSWELEAQVWSINQPSFQAQLEAMKARVASRDRGR